MIRRAALAIATAALSFACGPSLAPPPDAPPIPRDAPKAVFAWTTTLDADHPLTGRIWDAKADRFVGKEELEAAIAGGHDVLLGEKHDNVDHHRLQAAMIQSLLDRGRRPVVAMEMLDTDDQPKVDAARAASPGDVDAIFSAVTWEKKGWPPANEYAPILRVVVVANLPLVAANLPSRDTRALVHGGIAAIDPALAARLDLATPLPAPLAESLKNELREAHCGMLPEEMLEPMALAQRARDAEMAERMEATEAGGAAGAVLIAGHGHTRKDRGVPRVLAHLGETSVVSVAFVEVEHGKNDPKAYGAVWNADSPPFDYVWFTPRATDADPCEGMHAHAHKL